MFRIFKKNPKKHKSNTHNTKMRNDKHMYAMPQTAHCKHITMKDEDYLEAIINVSREKDYAKTRDVADKLGLSPPSVVDIVPEV